MKTQENNITPIKKVIREKKKTLKKKPTNSKKVRKVDTEKQKKFIRIFSENLGNKGDTKSLKEMLLEAGYSEKTALQQTAILKGIVKKGEVKDLVASLETERDKILVAMQGKRSKANYRDLVYAFDKITSNIQLLSDKPTENVKLFGDEKLRAIFARRNRGSTASMPD